MHTVANRQIYAAMGGSSVESTAQYYQSLFSDVAGLSSRELLRDSAIATTPSSIEQWYLRKRRVLLVDVRSESERKVSMIMGAVSLNDFKANILPSLEAKLDDVHVENVDDSSLPKIVIPYCTIGWRSGMEARKLMQDYPNLFVSWKNTQNDTNNDQRDTQNEKILIGNLDGILAFANAASLELQSHTGESNADLKMEKEMAQLQPLLIDGQTNAATNRVHVYGNSWKKYLPQDYEAITFSRIEFAWVGLQVICRACVLSCSGASRLCCKR